MKRILPLLLTSLLLAACQTNPYTNRSQFLALPESQELAMGVEAYSQVTAEEPISNDPALTAPLLRVGNAIAAQADRLRSEQGEAPYDWEFKVIDRPDTLNAWCLPGGKIGFYTGIYPILQDEAGMAIVMGHEVCHALLRHGGERVSQGIVTQAATTGAAILLGEDSEYRDEILGALGVGLQFGYVLPYSRSHEAEADRMGLMLAADAGYDPRAAIGIWERMAAASDGQRPPELLSTHPDPLNRIESMRQWMPEALERYERSQKMPNARLPAIPEAAPGTQDPTPPGAPPESAGVQPTKPKKKRRRN